MGRRESTLAFDQAMDQVRLLASKFQEYRNAAVGAQSLAVLAAVVCKYDKSQAPFFFHQALGRVQTRLQNEQEPGQKERLWYARALVISLGAECDAELAQQMNREAKPTPESLWSNLQAAHSLLEVNPDKALQFAQQVSTHVADLPHPQLLNFVSLLNKMREQAPSRADDLIATNRGFVEVVRFGDLRQNVEIRVDGLTFELSRVVQALASAPPEQLTAALFTLSNERRQGPALAAAAAAAAYLERTRPKLH
ncbi:MAG: hypothetical protein EXQ58_09625 [Acidobacteria bacterium]|nr:hypothetical protein [Acidobacteriota bacterium]